MEILSVLYKFEDQSMIIFQKLFDSKVQPVLLYAAEIWGLEDDYCYQVEKTHLFALKRFLSVSQRTPNNMMYGDTARYPPYINAYVHTVLYWLKITRMCETRLPYKTYLMLLHLDERGKTIWVTKVRLALFRSDFGYVWQSKGVQAINVFMHCFRQRLIDNRWQDWKSRIDVSDRFAFCRQFKTNHAQEAYLSS